MPNSKEEDPKGSQPENARNQAASRVVIGDCLEVLAAMPDNSVELVVTSPPYHGKMLRYGASAKGRMDAKQWAAWMCEVVTQCVRVSSGSVIVVANGCVQKNRYQPSCERLIVAAEDAGIRVDRPVVWHKNAPPNRLDWFGNNWEYVLAFGKNKTWNWQAIGKPPKFKAGGAFRQRNSKGARVAGGKYPRGKIARPRDVLRVTVGGGHLGSPLAHENAAPFPEKLVEPFILALSNPGDTVLDPFCGSGTTLAVALRLGRDSIGIDNRPCQGSLSGRRIAEARAKAK